VAEKYSHISFCKHIYSGYTCQKPQPSSVVLLHLSCPALAGGGGGGVKEVRVYIYIYGRFFRILWLINARERESHNLFICVTWLIHTCSKTHAYVQTLLEKTRKSFMHAPWRIHTCDVTNSYVRHDTTHVNVWHDSCICTNPNKSK